MSLRDQGRVSHLFALLTSGALFGASYIDLPSGAGRSLLQSLSATEPNASEREASGGGYYETLLNRGRSGDHSPDETSRRSLGKPDEWVDFHELQAARYFPGEFLQFELQPSISRPFLNQRFTTNSLGLRDREAYSVTKSPGVFRIVLLGSSIDMGWGVQTDETYENRLEDWLNHHATQLGLARRFEVLNFACAAYGPAQRLESYRLRAAAFQPDLVLYSVTMLDPRLSQIHLCELLQHRSKPTYDFVRDVVERAGVSESDLTLDSEGGLSHKDEIKRKLSPWLWSLSDGSLGSLATQCRATGTRLACLVVPRASRSDAVDERAPGLARHRAIASRHAVPLLDLTPAFDDEDVGELQLAPWDDHPNADGHRLLFYALAQALLADPGLRHLMFKP